MTEEQAIAAFRTGDQAAFAWLLKRYKHLVFTVTMRVLRVREEAEEAKRRPARKTARDERSQDRARAAPD